MKRKILITGAGGFVGANIALRLLKDENNLIYILVKESTDLWRLKEVEVINNERVKKVYCDLMDFAKLKESIERIQPEYIIHTAIYGGYHYQKDSEKTIKVNFNGTINLLEATKDIPYKCFINTGSSSEYGKKDFPMKEDDVLEPNSDYGVAKSAATLFCNYFAKKYNKPILTLRLFVPFGYYEDRDRLIPYILLSMIKGKDLTLGNPDSVRDFIFIEDVIDLYEKIIHLEKNYYGEVFNVGSGEQHSVKETAENIFEIFGKKLQITYSDDKKRSFDTDKWVADISKTSKEFNWKPKYSFKEGLNKNAEWFVKNFNLYESTDLDIIEKNARKMRLEIAKITEKVYGYHIGGNYSVLDILNVLYFKIMNIDPKNPKMPGRDKLIFSKGHNSLALYTVLSKRGFFDNDILNTYCQNGSILEGHVNYKVPGVEVSTGSLGHGLAIGIGMAIANKNQSDPGRIFVILGDGECNEGSIWEAAILASRLNLDNLTVIVDANKLQGSDSTSEIYGKLKLSELWKSFGFEVREINGHNYSEIYRALNEVPFKINSPSLIFCHTIKGKGVSFMENKLEWHYKSPTKEQLKIIEEELK